MDAFVHPPPGNKLMPLLADNNLTHVPETTRQNNILDLVISTKEELIVNVKIIDKNRRPSSNSMFNKNRKGKYGVRKKQLQL